MTQSIPVEGTTPESYLDDIPQEILKSLEEVEALQKKCTRISRTMDILLPQMTSLYCKAPATALVQIS